MRLILLVMLWSVATAGTALAESVVLPVKCVRADGQLFLEHSAPTSLRIVGSTSQRPYTVCAPKNGRHCRTLQIHKFDVMCAGQRIAWRDVAATIIRQRGSKAVVSEGRLKFRLAKKSFASLNAYCDRKRNRSAGSARERKLTLCSRKGYMPRETVELPSGFAPLAELGGRISEKALVSAPVEVKRQLVITEGPTDQAVAEQRGRIPLAGNEPSVSSTKPIRVAAVGKTTMALPGEGSVVREPKRQISDSSDTTPGIANSLRNATAALEKLPVRPTITGGDAASKDDAPSESVRVASAGKVGVATSTQSSWSETVSDAVKANFNAVTKPTPQMQQSLIATVIGLALITSLISGIGWFATQQILSYRSRTSDPYQLILRREVVDLAKPDAQMCGELCRTGQGLIGDIQGRVGDIKGAAPLRRVLLREVRAMEQFLATTIQTAPDDPREWRRMRLRLQRVVTDLIRLKDITDGARRSLTSRIISEDLPRDKQEAYEVLGANPEASEKILKRLVDALRATWHPDLATNDDDRELRDRRIKQINVAWDLIADKRSEA